VISLGVTGPGRVMGAVPSGSRRPDVPGFRSMTDEFPAKGGVLMVRAGGRHGAYCLREGGGRVQAV